MKNYIITFSITTLVLATISAILLMIFIPQEKEILTSGSIKYDQVNKADFKFEKTKDINKDSLVKEYTVTSDELTNFRKQNQYIAGNYDPFTPTGDLNNATNNNNQNNTTNNSNNANSGTPNPPSTNK
ncbi:MAG: hypothetical protein RSE41_01700 [Clostridia bacterium]